MVRNYLDCWCKVKLPILQQNVAEKLWVRGRPKKVGICKVIENVSMVWACANWGHPKIAEHDRNLKLIFTSRMTK
jgi:hypothetical protein